MDRRHHRPEDHSADRIIRDRLPEGEEEDRGKIGMKYFGRVPLCNHRAERGIFIGGFCLPLCARCTGIVLGAAAGLVGLWIGKVHGLRPVFLLPAFLLMLPTAADGGLEYGFGEESNNRRRFWTGILCGIGCAMIDRIVFAALFL